MFNSISGKYDFLDHLMSLNLDHHWRKVLVKGIKVVNPDNILDVATGTADLSIAIAKELPQVKITGVDIAEKMLEQGREKIKKNGFSNRINLLTGDAENLEFDNNLFDVVVISFGVRNFENLEQGLKEMKRVLKQGGVLTILEFSIPENFAFRWIYLFYFKHIVPFMGRLVSGNSFAYKYLPVSVGNFPYGKKFVEILVNLGFSKVSQKRLNLGICTIYSCIK